MYNVMKVDDDELWQSFVYTVDDNTFLHSLGWVDFNEANGHKTWKLGMYEDGKLISICLVLKIEAKRGTFLFVPHGPQAITLDQEMLYTWKTHLTSLAREQKCEFVRISSVLLDNPTNKRLFRRIGFYPAPIHMHAELTSILDLNRSEKEILMGMRKTTRQMVKKGLELIEKGEVTVEYPTAVTPEMYEVYHQTATRGHFTSFTFDYLNQEYDAFARLNKAKMVAIRSNGVMLSWGLFIYSGNRAFYHQGANILDKKVPASYLSHFLGFRLAKKRGCKSYDFWGVAPLDKPKHPWVHISLFKRGFGGEDLALMHAQDLPLSWKYWVTWVIERIRSKKRGFN